MGSCTVHGDEFDEGGRDDGGVGPVKTAGSTVTGLISSELNTSSSRDPAGDQSSRG